MNVKLECDFLLSEIKHKARNAGRFNLSKYLGTEHKLYNVSVPELRNIATKWVQDHSDIDIKLLDDLYSGQSREEKVLASTILGRSSTLLVSLDKSHIDRWLGQLEGWEEVDSMCDEIDVWLRADLKKRYHVLKHWNKDKQIEKRRASLVVLCSSVRHDNSKFLAELSFEFIDALKTEKHVMITKAISWLLRSLIKHHKADVANYLKKNTKTLPKIAIREVMRKLETGKK
ncbi:DNA alkylation repair protein [Candidatus Gottesmanbacteria bacterium]|nr:DNA alkylation repair protein [Candidatus Gottesmanbacteria bacterium]